MKKSGVIIDPKEMLAIKNKFLKVGLLEKDFHKELEETAKATRTKMASDFKSEGKERLSKRGEKTAGLVSLIRLTRLKRKDSVSAYSITSGSKANPIMAYIEFGTRNKNINTGGIRKMFGQRGVAFAKTFMRDGKRSNLTAAPYFYQNGYNEYKSMIKRLNRTIKSKLKK